MGTTFPLKNRSIGTITDAYFTISRKQCNYSRNSRNLVPNAAPYFFKSKNHMSVAVKAKNDENDVHSPLKSNVIQLKEPKLHEKKRKRK
jgi:hypothetical protein